MMAIRNRIWIEIDLDNLIFNYRLAKEATNRDAIAVIKADAYGHGAVEVAHALCDYEAQLGRQAFFAVATTEEALQLRRHRVKAPILLLGAAPVECAQVLVDKAVTVTITSLSHAQALSKNISRGTLQTHIKLETGMNRCGIPHDAVQDVLQAAALPFINVSGIYTHLCVADDPSMLSHTRVQIAAFAQATSILKEKGFSLVRHAANSASIIAHEDAFFDRVRPGVMLYGHDPCAVAFPLRPVMSIRARITQIKQIHKEEAVGYGCAWKAHRPSRIAVVSIGYADGLFRSLSGKMDMLVHGTRAPQVGRICMDMCMLDVTDIAQACVGDTATILGEDDGQCICMEELAALANTIPYEVYCAVGRRASRQYYLNGRLLDEINYVDCL